MSYQFQKISCVFVSSDTDDTLLCMKNEVCQLPSQDDILELGLPIDKLWLFDEVCSYEQDVCYEVTAYCFQETFDKKVVHVSDVEWKKSQACLESFSFCFETYLYQAFLNRKRYESQALVQQIHDDLKRLVKPKRYQHSVAVSQMAEKLAKRYHAWIPKASITGLAHDIAKYFTVEELIQYAFDHQLELTEADYLSPKILHGPIGSLYVKEHYEFTDDMCEAIYYHTTGHAGMTLLEKIIFMADKIDETRTYPGVDEIRELAFVDLNQAIQKFLDDRIVRVIQRQDYLHPLSLETRNDVFLTQLENRGLEDE